MTKNILNEFLTSIHQKVESIFSDIQSDVLVNNTLITFYFVSVRSVDDIYEYHKELILKLIN
jgi:hypothetical protein